MYPSTLSEGTTARDRSVEELVIYLSHAKKNEHVNTVMDLVRELSRVTAHNIAAAGREKVGMAEKYAQQNGHYPQSPQRIEIPANARKVKISF
jgi:hypothetical protein